MSFLNGKIFVVAIVNLKLSHLCVGECGPGFLCWKIIGDFGVIGGRAR